MTVRSRLRDHPKSALLVAGYALVVLVASVVHAPGESLHAAGPLGLVTADKWFHLAGYALLGLGVAGALRADRPRLLLAAVAVTVGFGAGIELLQATLPYRSGDALDAATNGVGACLGVGLWVVVRRLRATTGWREG